MGNAALVEQYWPLTGATRKEGNGPPPNPSADAYSYMIGYSNCTTVTGGNAPLKDNSAPQFPHPPIQSTIFPSHPPIQGSYPTGWAPPSNAYALPGNTYVPPCDLTNSPSVFFRTWFHSAATYGSHSSAPETQRIEFPEHGMSPPRSLGQPRVNWAPQVRNFRIHKTTRGEFGIIEREDLAPSLSFCAPELWVNNLLPILRA